MSDEEPSIIAEPFSPASAAAPCEDADAPKDEFAGLTFGQKAALIAKRAAVARVKEFVHDKVAPLIMAKAEKGFFFHIIHLEGEDADFVCNSGNQQAILSEISTLDVRVEFDRECQEIFVSWYSKTGRQSSTPDIADIDLASLSPRSRARAAKEHLKLVKKDHKEGLKEKKNKEKVEKKSMKEIKKDKKKKKKGSDSDSD
eukprot:CAMPEP_0177657916 /NCGR_PEP_ID=MMETSP0447-20121125/16496_1 /TAXON_ID=0 /ORGANISM="Stygamoeba regulata, Strain BSH-02190019" /LENGTH=199 /DNA_ID=CAMNT_0019162415 /DNA_START=51 /DNA_END=650 /DNA_ORIENTATION=+